MADGQSQAQLSPRYTARRLRKRCVDRVVNEGFREGFLAGVYGGLRYSLSYSSDSGLYDYNDVLHIAYEAGYAEADRAIANRGHFNLAPSEIKPTPECIALAYAAGRIGGKR